MQGPYTYARYPIAFGDAATGGGLLGGIALALESRAQTGNGMFVENSLFRSGIFCNARAILQVKDADKIKPNCSVLELPKPTLTREVVPRVATDGVYLSSDSISFGICARGHAGADSTLAAALQIEPKELSWKSVQAAVGKMTWEDAKVKVEGVGLPVVRQTEFEDIAWRGKTTYPAVDHCLTPLEGVADLDSIIAPPFDLGCSPNGHKAKFPAPKLGSHTKAWYKHGWSPVAANARMPKAASYAQPLQTAMCTDVVIFELSESGASSIAAATRMLGEMTNANIVKITLTEGSAGAGKDNLETSAAKFYNHLKAGKVDVTCTLDEIPTLIEKAGASNVVFATNLPHPLLAAAGVDHATLLKRFPAMIYGFVTPLGLDGPHNIRGEIASWFLNGPASTFFGGYKVGPPDLTPQLGELVTANYVAAAVAIALFHRRRTGEGQLAHVAMNRSSTWSSATLLPFLASDKVNNRYKLLVGGGEHPCDGEGWWKVNMPLLNSFQTRDGVWVIVLGVPIGSLVKYFKVFNCKYEAFLGAARIIGGSMWNKNPGGMMGHVFRGLASWNLILQREIGKKSYDEFKTICKENDLWWAPVATAEDVLRVTQARVIGAISDDAKQIHCPVQLGTKKDE